MSADPEHVLLVTGSRDWKSYTRVAEYIEGLNWIGSSNLLINGYARGADQYARTAAILLGWQVNDYRPEDFQNEWMSYGHACNVRNQVMVDHLAQHRMLGRETRSAAFWRAHSTGTYNTISMLHERRHILAPPDVMYDCPCHRLTQAPTTV